MTGDPDHAREAAPLLTTPREAARVLGLTVSQLRSLIREGRLAYLVIGRRPMIPREALQQFVLDNVKAPMPCPDGTKAHASAFLTSAAHTTSPGPSMVAHGSAARARQIASKLKSRSPNRRFDTCFLCE
jgi:excisionase family DNA binding protein